MSVKSTVYLTRDAAQDRYINLRREEIVAAAERQARIEARVMTDTELEDAVERLNDRAHDGEGYENYLIREET